MNIYCNICKGGCEEIIPTFNCKFQNVMDKKQEIVKTIDEIQLSLDEVVKNVNELQTEAPTQMVIRKPTVQTVTSDFNELTFDDKRIAFYKMFSLGEMGTTIDNKLILISLVGSFYLLAKKKDPSIKILDIVYKVIDGESNIAGDPKSQQFKEMLAIMVEEFLYGVQTGNMFGLKNPKELKDKINDILSQRMPF